MIVDLDRSMPRDGGPADRPTLSRPAISSALLLLGCVAFAVVVLVGRPASAIALTQAPDLPISGMAVPHGAILKPLQLPRAYVNVDLAAMPDRLANEAAPWTLRSVVVIRGTPGVADAKHDRAHPDRGRPQAARCLAIQTRRSASTACTPS